MIVSLSVVRQWTNMNVKSPVEVKFTGFRPGTHAAAIHSTLSNTPQAEEHILRKTLSVAKKRKIKNPARRIRDHLRYWTSRQVYVQIEGKGWILNPHGVRFVPREWAH